ncbi:MAG: glycoside hydrolase [bacterium]
MAYLSADGTSHTYWLNDARTGRLWHAESNAGNTRRLLGAAKTDGTRLAVKFEDTHKGNALTCEMSLDPRGSASFTIGGGDHTGIVEVAYPPRFEADIAGGELIFCNRSCGNRVPQNDNGYRNAKLVVYANTDASDMPWIGVVDPRRGDGLMWFYGTPWEALVFFQPDSAGRLWPQVGWFDSKGALAYERKVTLYLVPSGGYVAQAKLYRELVRGEGRLIPLRDRVARRPHVAWLRGAPIVWGTDGLKFARQAANYGIRRGVFIIAGGRPAPAEIEQMTRMGFLTSEYDSYTDFLEGPMAMQSDHVESAAYRKANGSPMEGWRTLDGTQFFNRSSAMARKTAQALLPAVLDRYPMTARFIDVTPSMHFIEDYHPDHSFTRRGDMENRIKLLSYFSEQGLVVGGEHGKAWTQPWLDYSEGPMSGSFYWLTKVGPLVPLSSRDEIDPKWQRYGHNWRLRIPIYDLVFHDSVVNTWYWGDSTDFLYNVAPELSDSKDLTTLLYGSVPLMWANNLGYGWDRNRGRFLQSYRQTCLFAEAVAFDEMLSHETLTDNRDVQRTRFASGAEAVVNFGVQPFQYAPLGGTTQTLSPGGFYARAKDVEQAQTIVDGTTVTFVNAPRFYLHESAGAPSPNAQGRGPLCVFQLNERQWNIVAGPGGPWRFDTNRMKGFPGIPNGRFFDINANGQILGAAPLTMREGVIETPALGHERLFALRADLGNDDVVIAPDEGDVADTAPVTLLCANPNLTMHYTLDGSDTSSTSPVYESPFPLVRSATLRARAFRGGEAAGHATSATLTFVRSLADTGVMRGGSGVKPVSMDLAGVRELRLRLTDAGDGLDYDTGVVANPLLEMTDGTTVSLTSLMPDQKRQRGPDPEIALGPFAIKDQLFGFGFSTHPMADYVYKLDAKAKRLDAFVGVNDRADAKGSVRFTFHGVY